MKKSFSISPAVSEKSEFILFKALLATGKALGRFFKAFWKISKAFYFSSKAFWKLPKALKIVSKAFFFLSKAFWKMKKDLGSFSKVLKIFPQALKTFPVTTANSYRVLKPAPNNPYKQETIFSNDHKTVRFNVRPYLPVVHYSFYGRTTFV